MITHIPIHGCFGGFIYYQQNLEMTLMFFSVDLLKLFYVRPVIYHLKIQMDRLDAHNNLE